jgi:L-alanine-DL-glutamate epimerase-like enolase superfamily enzyme
LPGLSPDWHSEQDWERALALALQEFNVSMNGPSPRPFPEAWEPWLDEWRSKYPSIAFGLENILHQIYYSSNTRYPDSITRSTLPEIIAPSTVMESSSLRINGLVWMNDPETMRQDALCKVAQGFDCLKFKIGALDWEAELNMIAEIRNLYPASALEIRVDANGSLNPDQAVHQLAELHNLEVHSIEQPLAPLLDQLLPDLAQSVSLPIALDESMLLRKPNEASSQWLANSGAKYLVLKPGLLGGFKVTEAWIRIAEDLGMGWWITSALESNIGLGAIASWTFHQVLQRGNPLAQGLGTGTLYADNFPATTFIRDGRLHPLNDWDPF